MQPRGRPPTIDGRTTVGLVVIVVIICAIQMAIPSSVTFGPTDYAPLVELTGVVVVLWLARSTASHSRSVRWAMNFFLTVLVAATVMNALLLLWTLLDNTNESGVVLLLSGFGVLGINVLSFGLVYWWIDVTSAITTDGSPASRRHFLFPQQGMAGQDDWRPTLTDYLFTAYTNIIAFSPTDTMPLTHRTKALFTLQSATALLTIVVTVSRAINLIPGGPTIGG